jgi:hypothetical protein
MFKALSFVCVSVVYSDLDATIEFAVRDFYWYGTRLRHL